MVLSIEHTAHTSGSIKDVWDQWKKVEEWPKWDNALQASNLQKGHKFCLGSECVLTIYGNPQPIVARITAFALRKNFTTRSESDLGVVTIHHEVGLSDQGVSITHKMTFDSKDKKTKEVFEKNIWPHLSSGLVKAVDTLAALSNSIESKGKRENDSLEGDDKIGDIRKVKSSKKISYLGFA